MTALLYSFEGGTNGSGITTGNTGPGDTDFDHVISGATFSTAHPAHGILSGLYGNTASSTTATCWNQATQSHAARAYVYMTSLPPQNLQLIRLLTGANSTGGIALAIRILATGKLVISNAGLAANLWTSTTTLSLNTQYRIEYSYNTSNGQIIVTLYVGDSTSGIESSGVIATASPTWASIDFAAAFSGSQTYTGLWLDDVGVNLATTTLLGPSGGNALTVTITDTVGLQDPGSKTQIDETINDTVGTADTTTAVDSTTGGSSAVTVVGTLALTDDVTVDVEGPDPGTTPPGAGDPSLRAGISGQANVPHLVIPFTLAANGSAAVVEQDTPAEITQSVAMLLGTVAGSRTVVADYGVTDPTFTGPDVGEITDAVAEWEPRADVTVTMPDPPNSPLRVTVAVRPETSS